MDQIFNWIYLPIFQDMFGMPLSDYVSGYSSDTNLLIPIGLVMIGISLFIAVLYYYIVNKPKLSLWWGWAIFLGINFIINFLVGWQWMHQDMNQNWPNLYEDSEPIVAGVEDVMLFGLANAIISVITFFIVSLLVKWGSKNCSHSPF